jgi:hypothetical protein
MVIDLSDGINLMVKVATFLGLGGVLLMLGLELLIRKIDRKRAKAHIHTQT